MQKFTPNYSKHNCDVKQEDKSYDMQKFTPATEITQLWRHNHKF